MGRKKKKRERTVFFGSMLPLSFLVFRLHTLLHTLARLVITSVVVVERERDMHILTLHLKSIEKEIPVALS